jgi:internalin A
LIEFDLTDDDVEWLFSSISGKKIIEYTSRIEEIDFSSNKLTKLPAFIGRSLNLKRLNLQDNQIQVVSTDIGNLTKIQELNLRDNKLIALPAEIGNLRSLKSLDISRNKITNLPIKIGNLTNLEYLHISRNQFSLLPAQIGGLTNLKMLQMGFNNITELPVEIGDLKNLKRLEFPKNNIKTLPRQIKKLDKLVMLSFGQNPVEEIFPIEILRLGDSEAQKVLSYYFATLTIPQKHLNETKLLLIGEPGVGKTSLVQQIIHGTFDPNQTKTEGISINQWQIQGGKKREPNSPISNSPVSNLESSIRLNIWDFGGQEIMHATHQFFLTKRSLYLLVLDARLTQEENRVEHWLKIIQSFGGESPVLIVGNKTDQHPLDIDRTGLQKKYPNIVGILETSAATGAGIEALKAEIAKQVDTLPHVRDLLPETWFTVKSKLEELGRDKNFITQDEYLNLCGASEVTDETSQHTLIGFLHDLGVVLHFQDDPRLEALGILNPQWVTNGVYKILNSHELFQNQGTLTLPILNKTLNLPEYPSNKRLFIVDMMKKFELCYDIEPDKSFLIPDLLPKDEIYTGEWNDALAFQIHYNVLPSSIITRFIVRMNSFIHKNTIWRSGVVLKREENTALIKADVEERKIYISVSGKEDTRRDLLAMIRGEFDAIHKTIAKIEATEKVPLPNAPEADPVDLTFLQRAASEGRESLPVQVGNRIIDLLVKEVLSQIEKEGKSSSSQFVVNVQGNVYGSIGNSNTVNFIQQKFEPIYEAIEASSRDATEKQDLVAEVGEIKDEVAKGEQANESFLARRLRNLKKTAPDIAEVALATLANPTAGVAMIVQKIARKIKEETK